MGNFQATMDFFKNLLYNKQNWKFFTIYNKGGIQMYNTDINDLEKLQYLQSKIHEITLDCINTFSLAEQKDSLFYTFLSLVFMRFRDSIDTSVANPARLKANQSVIDNIEKEVLKKLNNNLPDNYSLDDIDKMAKKVVQAVCKDYLGATIVFHSKNNCSTYCEESEDSYVKALYKSLLTTEEYLRSNDKIHEQTLFSKLYHHFQKLDISNTFIDDEPNPLAPRKVKPLDLKNISTLEKYYDTKIALLTLLTNHSIPCTEYTDGKKHKYCVSELDVPYLQLVKQTMDLKPKNKDEAIKILIGLAHENYFREYVPFDEQLDLALKERELAKQSNLYSTKILDVKLQNKYTQELTNLKNNLNQLKNDRLLNYILTLELPNIFHELSELPNLNVKIKSHKERAKSSGFYACYYTVELNGIVVGEVLGNSEFRYNLSKEGYAAHNTMYKKSFDIKPLFELRAFPLETSEQAKRDLDFYCEFLSTLSLNDVSGYHIPKEEQKALKYLKELVSYAQSQIKVRDYITIQNGNEIYQMPFFDYMTSVIEAKGAKYVTIYPAHIVEHNQSIAVPQSPLYSLENLLKSRIGFSVLANMIREKYVHIATTEKHDKLLANSPVRSYSSTLTPKYDLPIDNLSIKEIEENYEPLDIDFHPMGQYVDDER